jgi:hypothetical protein
MTKTGSDHTCSCSPAGECEGQSPVKNAIPGETGGEADLVRLIMAGDQLAEKELVQRYSRGTSIIIRHRVKNAADVEDFARRRSRKRWKKSGVERYASLRSSPGSFAVWPEIWRLNTFGGFRGGRAETQMPPL